MNGYLIMLVATRRQVPDNTTSIVGMVDINHDGLRWGIAAVTNERCISVIDYGIYPGHGIPLISGEEADPVALMRGLSGLDGVMQNLVIRKGGQRVYPELLLVDCGGQWIQSVFDWVGSIRRRSPVPWVASRGWSSKYYRPNRNLIGQPGDGFHLARWEGKGHVLVHDSDLWRMRQHKGWLLPIGAPDSISLFGAAGERHEVFAREVTAERLVAYVESDGGPFYKWVMHPGMRNDWGDVATGLYVAAARLGLTPTGRRPVYRPTKPRKPKVEFVSMR